MINERADYVVADPTAPARNWKVDLVARLAAHSAAQTCARPETTGAPIAPVARCVTP
ncbi:hypothetical protein [Sphingomonas sp. NBWT7]|uniref:hypothetical protein n=1 Tax=Sphingomonas sp. NBWT7 TaxID=2596913 RepID=UPI001623DB89|nr:hypothetical protein [Sphingomonas sp. NBWT7]